MLCDPLLNCYRTCSACTDSHPFLADNAHPDQIESLGKVFDMSHTNVSSCVLSIIASFTSGLDVFKNLRDTRTGKKRRTKRNASVEDEERRLVRSLRQGPEDIGREYQRGIQAAGQDFANGDGMTHRFGAICSRRLTYD